MVAAQLRAFAAMERGARTGLSMAEIQASISLVCREHGCRVVDLLHFASYGAASDADVLPAERKLTCGQWAERLAARGE